MNYLTNSKGKSENQSDSFEGDSDLDEFAKEGGVDLDVLEDDEK